MSKKERSIQRKGSIRRKECNLRCPSCSNSIDDPADLRRLGLREEDRLLLSQPGDLTECDFCRAILVYCGDRSSLKVQLAPKQRADAIQAMLREGPREPSLPELIAYVMRNRQMPVRPPIGHRFRKSSNTI